VRDNALEPEAGWAKAWGPALIFRRLWGELGLPVILERLLGDAAAVSDYPEAIFVMVLSRVCDPASKLRVSEWIKRVYRPDWASLELQHFYGPWTFSPSIRPRSRRRLTTGRATYSAFSSTSCSGTRPPLTSRAGLRRG